MRAAWLVLIVVACADPEKLAQGVCGNGVVDTGEDCEPIANGGAGTCAAPDTADACHYTCIASACPAGFGCGQDGRCRAASGRFTLAPTSPLSLGAGAMTFADLDGDTRADLVLTDSELVAFGDGRGDFGSSVAFGNGSENAVGDFTGDGRADVEFFGNGNTIIEGRANRRPSPILFPLLGDLTFGDGTTGQPEWWIPVRPTSTDPTGELLHVVLASDHVRIGFDEFSAIGLADPGVVTLAGARTPANAPLTVAQVPVADVFPGSGGDEVAIGFLNDSVVHIYTATTTIVDGSPVATLTARPNVALPGVLAGALLFTDMDGDGHLDLVATVRRADTTLAAAIALGNGTTLAAMVVDDPMSRAQCFPTAAANITGDGRAELWCNGLAARVAGNEIGHITSAAGPSFNGPEAVFVDLNHDGILDVVSADTHALQIQYGRSDGLFSFATIPVSGTPHNLRTGDFDGDRTQDVAFLVPGTDSQRSTISILYGATSGPPALVSASSVHSPMSFEPVLLGGSNPVLDDGTTDLVLDALDTVHGRANLIAASGDASRIPVATFFPSSPRPEDLLLSTARIETAAAGRFTAGATRDQLLLLGEAGRATGNDVLRAAFVYDVGVDPDGEPDGSSPQLRAIQPLIATPVPPPGCAVFAHANVDGDPAGIEEMITLQAGHGGPADPCTQNGADARPQLLVLDTTHDDLQSPTIIDSELRGIQHVLLADVDGDGHVDAVALMSGSPAGVLVIWGTSAGLGVDSSELALPAPASDLAVLDLDGDPQLELLLATASGVVAYDLGAARTWSAGTPILGLTSLSPSTTLGSADVDGDGVTDLVVDDEGVIRVYLAAPSD